MSAADFSTWPTDHLVALVRTAARQLGDRSVFGADGRQALDTAHRNAVAALDELRSRAR